MKHSALHIAQTLKQHTTNQLSTAWEEEVGDAAVAEWIGMRQRMYYSVHYQSWSARMALKSASVCREYRFLT
jgi:hypothetical protein